MSRLPRDSLTADRPSIIVTIASLLSSAVGFDSDQQAVAEDGDDVRESKHLLELVADEHDRDALPAELAEQAE